MSSPDATPPSPELLEAAAATLAAAFFDDPLYRVCFPDPATRMEDALHLFRFVLGYALRYGWVDIEGADARGVAVWLVPGETRMTLWRELVTGGLALPFQIGLHPLRVLAAMETQTAPRHQEYAPEPHYYLLLFGVRPGCQGQGIGARMLRRGVARARGEGVGLYLETNSSGAQRFYLREGFTLVDRFAEGGVEGWCLVARSGG